MIRHIVLFAFTPETSAEQAGRVAADFAKLPGAIPGIEAFEWGRNVSPEQLGQGYTHAFVVTFTDAAARDAYLVHPAHERFVAGLRPHLARALVFDFDPDPGSATAAAT